MFEHGKNFAAVQRGLASSASAKAPPALALAGPPGAPRSLGDVLQHYYMAWKQTPEYARFKAHRQQAEER
jgi:hypothetical protein